MLEEKIDEKNAFNGTWKIAEVFFIPDERGQNRVPMECNDRITITVFTSTLVTFERQCAGGTTDPAWAETRGVYNKRTGEIVGQILKDQDANLKTEFLIKAEEGNRILGKHRHNPNDGEWTGNPD